VSIAPVRVLPAPPTELAPPVPVLPPVPMLTRPDYVPITVSDPKVKRQDALARQSPPGRNSRHAVPEISFGLFAFLACTREPVQSSRGIGIGL
jgi:hypothetical protein